jgi:putative Mg2+ transporter-C (MgtC) family protein
MIRTLSVPSALKRRKHVEIGSFSFDWSQALTDFIRVLIAFTLALPIGWERALRSRSIGLRTFPIVAMASCGFILVVRVAPGANIEADARILQGLLAGIGFIGGGAILKQETGVRGLATAASIWNTGAIGAAVAFQRVEIAVVLSVVNFLTLYLLTPIAEKRWIILSSDSEAGKDDA